VTVSGATPTAPRTVVTDGNGEYVVDALPAGRYLVTTAFNGFEPTSAAIGVGATAATLDVVLIVSSLAEGVTVTATKTGAADVQSTPVAITVLPATALDEMGVHPVEGLAGVVPTVTISQNTGLAQVTIRGIGSNSTFGDPSSTVHLDGVYLGRPSMVFADFLNVERVEVLRGPQGTLYGRNSVGGTINIVTRQPTNTLETSVRLTAGNYDHLRAEGAVSGPLVKNKVMGNVAILRNTREGFVHDLDHPDLTRQRRHVGRTRAAACILRTHGELLLSGTMVDLTCALTYAKPIAAKPAFPVPFDSPTSLGGADERLTSGKNIQQGARRSWRSVEPNDDADQPDGVSEINYRVFIDADATELQVQTADVPDVQRQVSQELTLVQRTPTLTWIGGAFFFDDHNEGQVEVSFYHPSSVSGPAVREDWDTGAGAVRPGNL
jgi:iron complex outermembrane receptor protein